jgi:hypothetical protein
MEENSSFVMQSFNIKYIKYVYNKQTAQLASFTISLFFQTKYLEYVRQVSPSRFCYFQTTPNNFEKKNSRHC